MWMALCFGAERWVPKDLSRVPASAPFASRVVMAAVVRRRRAPVRACVRVSGGGRGRSCMLRNHPIPWNTPNGS